MREQKQRHVEDTFLEELPTLYDRLKWNRSWFFFLPPGIFLLVISLIALRNLYYRHKANWNFAHLQARTCQLGSIEEHIECILQRSVFK